jgi:hypothetical protein
LPVISACISRAASSRIIERAIRAWRKVCWSAVRPAMAAVTRRGARRRRERTGACFLLFLAPPTLSARGENKEAVYTAGMCVTSSERTWSETQEGCAGRCCCVRAREVSQTHVHLRRIFFQILKEQVQNFELFFHVRTFASFFSSSPPASHSPHHARRLPPPSTSHRGDGAGEGGCGAAAHAARALVPPRPLRGFNVSIFVAAGGHPTPTSGTGMGMVLLLLLLLLYSYHHRVVSSASPPPRERRAQRRRRQRQRRVARRPAPTASPRQQRARHIDLPGWRQLGTRGDALRLSEQEHHARGVGDAAQRRRQRAHLLLRRHGGGLYRLNPVVTHGLKAPGFNP